MRSMRVSVWVGSSPIALRSCFNAFDKGSFLFVSDLTLFWSGGVSAMFLGNSSKISCAVSTSLAPS